MSYLILLIVIVILVMYKNVIVSLSICVVCRVNFKLLFILERLNALIGR